jgi:hypothetical protein
MVKTQHNEAADYTDPPNRAGVFVEYLNSDWTSTKLRAPEDQSFTS